MTPSKAVFDGVYMLCAGIGNTTDFIDEEKHGRELPIILIGEGNIGEEETLELIGTVNQTIHVYGLPTQRFELDEIAGRIRNGLKSGIAERGYKLTNPTVTTRILQDNSTSQTLIHYVLDYSVTFNK